MSFRRHLLRDVVLLSLPLVAILGYLLLAAGVSFYNAEIRNFHGYLVRGLRVGTPRQMLRYHVNQILHPQRRNFLSDVDTAASKVRVFDLRVDGAELDALMSALPASADDWRPAWLNEPSGASKVEVRNRGQRLDNYFFATKSWKIKTGKRSLVEGCRTVNLTPLQGRMDNHLTFLVARHVGLPAPFSRPTWLFLNKEDQGIFLQEEQIDESMLRRVDRMPGDVFYGELFVPDEPKLSSDDVFSNPFLWEKKASYNRYEDEYRPYLTEMLDQIASPDLASFDRLFDVLDRELFAQHFALISFQGDQHLDHSHNHKFFFNPLTGTFEPIVWNARLNMPRGRGVESMANRLYRKVSRDPRFLDDVHGRIARDFLAPGSDMTALQREELERVHEALPPQAVGRRSLIGYLQQMKAIVEARGETVRRWHAAGRVVFEEEAKERPRTENDEVVTVLSVHAYAAASLRLEGILFAAEPRGVSVYEDRDFDGQLSPGDRPLAVRPDGRRLQVETADALLYTGRDFRAPYLEKGAERDSFTVHREYTQLAFLRNPLLLVGASVPEIQTLEVVKTVGPGDVDVRRGAPGYVSTETVHPWGIPAPPPPRVHSFQGSVTLTEDLLLGPGDRFEAAPGTELLLGPGVSIRIQNQVSLRGVRVRRLDPDSPWGVIAILGPAASGSELRDCDIEGGSDATLGFVYYSGMLSIHYADHVRVVDSRFGRNVLGDDSVRFARCHDLLVDGVLVEKANGDAIDCDISTGRIQNTRILAPHNDGLDLMTCQVSVDRLTVEDAGDKGISMGESATPHVTASRLVRCNIGVAIKDGSEPLLEDMEILNCGVALDGYDKNWRYPGGGRGRARGCRLEGNGMDVRLRGDSYLILEETHSEQKFSLPDGEEHRLQVLPRAGETQP